MTQRFKSHSCSTITDRIILALERGPLSRHAIAEAIPDIPWRNVYSRVSVLVFRGVLLKSAEYPAVFSVFRMPYREGHPTREEMADPARCVRPRAACALQEVWH